MSYHGPKARLARRFGVSWTPKGDKILARRPNPPGQHGPDMRRGRESVYKKQLTQKQLLRAQYNIREKQMRNYFLKALKSRGNYDEELIRLLETRLDALVLRAGFAQTIYAARQYVNHGHVLVNDTARLLSVLHGQTRRPDQHQTKIPGVIARTDHQSARGHPALSGILPGEIHRPIITAARV